MNFFNFSRAEYERICYECMLNDEYAKLLEMEIKDYSRAKMADELGVSIDTIDKMVAKLKEKIKRII